MLVECDRASLGLRNHSEQVPSRLTSSSELPLAISYFCALLRIDHQPRSVGRLKEMSDAAISATGLSSAPQHSPSVLPHLLSASWLGDLFLMSDSPLLPGGVPQTMVTLRKAVLGRFAIANWSRA